MPKQRHQHGNLTVIYVKQNTYEQKMVCFAQLVDNESDGCDYSPSITAKPTIVRLSDLISFKHIASINQINAYFHRPSRLDTTKMSCSQLIESIWYIYISMQVIRQVRRSNRHSWHSLLKISP